MRMKLSEFAKKRGISYQTAWRWFKTGKFPPGITAEQMPTGTVIVTDASFPSEPTELPSPGSGVYLYARVPTPDQKNELEAQLGRLAAYAAAQGWTVIESVTEIGSGFSERRPELMRLLSNPDVKAILIEHRDRLLRFGSAYVETSLRAQGRKLIVMEPFEFKGDLAQDMVEVLTSFCVQLYGHRPAKNKVRKALKDLSHETPS